VKQQSKMAEMAALVMISVLKCYLGHYLIQGDIPYTSAC